MPLELAVLHKTWVPKESPPYDPSEVGKRLRIIRKAHGLSQSAFAKQAGISASALANWEQGRQRPKMNQAERIIDAFGVTLDYLMLGRSASLRHDVATALLAAERNATSPSSEKPH